MFARAGYDAPPPDWAGWKTALHKVKEQAGDGNYALLYPLNEYEQLTTLALSAGARMLRDEGGRGAFSEPEFRSEEHTSELQSLMRISYAVFCLKKKITLM